MTVNTLVSTREDRGIRYMSDLTFTIDDALDLAHVSAPEWNRDGSCLSYLRFEDGETFLATVETNDAISEVTDPAEIEYRSEPVDVSGFDWHPEDPSNLVLLAENDLYLGEPLSESYEPLATDVAEEIDSPTWHPEGDHLAYRLGDHLQVHTPTTGRLRHLSDPRGHVAAMFGGTEVSWSPDGSFLATFTETNAGALGLSVFSLDDDEDPVIFRHHPRPDDGEVVSSFEWVGPGHLVYGVDSVDGRYRTYRSVYVDAADSAMPILSESDACVLPRDAPVSAGNGLIAVLSARTGYHHVYVVDIERRRNSVLEEQPGFEGEGITQVTDGQYEARGDAITNPAWSVQGDRLAFVTNEYDRGERRLYAATIANDGSVTEVIDMRPGGHDGNTIDVAWAPESDHLLCIRAGRTSPAAVHVVDPGTDVSFTRVADTHPATERFKAFPEPEPVSFASDDGTEIYGYLYEPTRQDGSEKHPAVVWCHGGPIRQMRRGFHHMRSYAYFHAFNHVLVSRGYVVLALNFRGGIGYGREYEHGIHHAIGEVDVADCIGAATFLRSQPTIGDSVGLWGLSYGGFLANAVAVGTDAFDCAVNFAGIWDWAEWVRYATERYWGVGRMFSARFGGHPDDDPEIDAGIDDHEVAHRYANGSPGTDFEGLQCPLFSLHGTDDPNVPFEQMDLVTEALVQAREGRDGVGFQSVYYPDEDHMFQSRATWEDALPRVLNFFEDHLEG